MKPSDTVKTPPESAKSTAPPRRRWKWTRRFFKTFLVIALLLAAVRPFLPYAVRWYVNRTLDQSPIYRGTVGEITLHLWRGAYSIHDVRLNKMTGNVPVPLFAAKRVDFQVQWSALLHGKVVGQMVMEEPELNFVDSKSEDSGQSGAGGPWLQIIQDLFPFKINSAVVQSGSIHFRTFESVMPVDIFLDHLEATLDNLTNIQDETTPLVTTVNAKAMAMGQAPFEYMMKLDPFSYRPSFHMATRLVGLDVTKLNDLAKTYGAFDFEQGYFDLVLEVDAKEGAMAGYVKPLFRNLHVFSLTKDIEKDNVVEFFWEALVGATTQLLKNQSRDQFGTLIPFRGDTSGSRPDILGTVGNVLRNAFIRAYLPRLQKGVDDAHGLQFDPGVTADSLPIGDQQ